MKPPQPNPRLPCAGSLSFPLARIFHQPSARTHIRAKESRAYIAWNHESGADFSTSRLQQRVDYNSMISTTRAHCQVTKPNDRHEETLSMQAPSAAFI